MAAGTASQLRGVWAGDSGPQTLSELGGLGLSFEPELAVSRSSAIQSPLAVLILAHNESAVLARTLKRLESCLGSDDQLHVVADQCTDETAELARRSGAHVHVRAAWDGKPGKGGALRWWVERTREHLGGDRPVVILDADSIPSPDLLDRLRQQLASGAAAVQAEVRPALTHLSAVGHLAAFSEVTEQGVFDAWRARFGWPIRLRGTGMAFQRPVLERAAKRLSTRAEDIELTVLLGSWGESIEMLRGGFVLDPKPADTPGAIRQRARWLQGQVEVLSRHPKDVARLLLRGPAGWSLLESLFLRPKTFFLPLKAIGVAAAWAATAATGSTGLGAAAVGVSLWLALDAAGLIAGLRKMPEDATTRHVLLALPVYAGLWLRSLLLSVVSREPWLRSRLPVSRVPAYRGEDET